MKLKTVGFLSVLLIVGTFVSDGFCAVQASNRAATTTTSVRSTKSVSRQPSTAAVGVKRSNVERSGATVSRKATVGKNSSVRIATKPSVVRSTTSARSGVLSNIVRAAKNFTSARSAATVKHTNAARATAVFNDVTKIGSGYANCRDAYATCMDQFCAKLNDTYRRCICSDKYSEFRDSEDALEEALTLLAKFEDNNLNAVDKTVEEINALYSATAGEMVVKKDTSAAAKMLNEIDGLMSGGKKAKKQSSTYTSLNGTVVEFDSDIEDVWAVDTSENSIFGSKDKVKDISTYEGVELYNAASEQCLQVVSESCANDATLTMAKSSYSVMVSNDCNTYSKKIDTKREKVQETVRTAEKYLREARLEEYRAHNSADMNTCVTAVKNAIQTDAACGSNYVRCLDNTGVYINSTTGEPIYSPRFFQLKDLIKLDGTSDALGQVSNQDFEFFLDSKRKYAETALNTCRDIAEDVWTEFKRGALIEISQAQDDKIEEVKMSCVQTMSECYDTQLGGLKEMDTSKLQMSGVAGVQAARDLCQDKVIACASLYGDTDGCQFDGNGKLTSGNNSEGNTSRCGIDSLLAFVDTVDVSRMSEACDTTIDNYLKDMCTPDSGNYEYPYKCRLKPKGILKNNLEKIIGDSCSNDLISDDKDSKVQTAMDNLAEQMDYVLGKECENLEGYWLDVSETELHTLGNNTIKINNNDHKLLIVFYNNVFGGNKSQNEVSWGACVENSVMVQCLANNNAEETVAQYNKNLDKCEFTDVWFTRKCESIGGHYETGSCYFLNNTGT